MNATSKYIYDSANYYFNGNKDLMKKYFSSGVKDMLDYNSLHITTLKNVKKIVKPLSKNQRISRIGKHIKGDTKHNKEVDKIEHLLLYQKNQIRKDIVDKLHDNKDLVMLDDNDGYSADDKNGKGNGKYHILTKKYFLNIQNSLHKFLLFHTTKKWQINWILQHKPISDAKFAKIVNMKANQITNYRTGKVNIDKMLFKNALDIDHYYILFTGRKINDEKAPNKSDIKESKNEIPAYLFNRVLGGY